MKITINGQELSYELQQEQYIGQIIPKVEEFLFGQGHYITQLQIDNKMVRAHECAGQLIADAGLFAIESELFLELDETIKRAENLLKHVSEGAGCDLNHCQQNIIAWAKSVRFWLQNFSLSADFFNVLLQLPSFSGTQEEQALYSKSLTVVLRCLKERDEELEAPLAAVDASMQALIEKSAALSELGLSLQANQDATTAYELLLLAEALHRLERVIALLPELFEPLYWEIRDWLVDITQYVPQMVAAFEAKDYVLVADLAEYEVAERLEALKDIHHRYQAALENNT